MTGDNCWRPRLVNWLAIQTQEMAPFAYLIEEDFGWSRKTGKGLSTVIDWRPSQMHGRS